MSVDVLVQLKHNFAIVSQVSVSYSDDYSLKKLFN